MRRVLGQGEAAVDGADQAHIRQQMRLMGLLVGMGAVAEKQGIPIVLHDGFPEVGLRAASCLLGFRNDLILVILSRKADKSA
jgi:hypothetical protein